MSYPAQTVDGETVMIAKKRHAESDVDLVLTDEDGNEYVVSAQNPHLLERLADQHEGDEDEDAPSEEPQAAEEAVLDGTDELLGDEEPTGSLATGDAPLDAEEEEALSNAKGPYYDEDGSPE